METIRLTAEVTGTDLDDLFEDRKIETLDECFRRIRREWQGTYPLTFDHQRHSTHLWGFLQATAHGTRRPYEALKIVEIYAAWVQASLDAIEAHWSAEMDRLLAAFVPGDPEASTIDHAEFCRAMTALEVSCGVKRTNITKAAYGVTYKEFTK